MYCETCNRKQPVNTDPDITSNGTCRLCTYDSYAVCTVACQVLTIPASVRFRASMPRVASFRAPAAGVLATKYFTASGQYLLINECTVGEDRTYMPRSGTVWSRLSSGNG